MTRFHADWLAGQRQRFIRPDAGRFLRPDWRRYAKPGFELDDGGVLVERKAGLDRRRPPDRSARGREHDARQTSREERARRREILRVRWELAALRFEVAMLRHYAALRKANFNPNQPRVPAGVPEGGQWTDTGGGIGGDDINDRRIIADVAPDDVFPPGSRLAQNESERRYSVNLLEEETRGGHTLREHVDKSGAELLASVRGDRGQVGIYRYARIRHGSFDSREAANDFVNRTLERNREAVDHVASGRMRRLFLTERFGYRTGIEAFRANINSEPYFRVTYEVGLEIRHDPRAARGYRVHTAYPRNSRPQ